MTGGVVCSGWWSKGWSKPYRPGSCDGAVPDAVTGSPTTHPFALPHKRFVKQAVLETSKVYLGTDVTYEKAVWGKQVPIQYDPKEGGVIARGKDPLPRLAPSTVWRWLSWLGGFAIPFSFSFRSYPEYPGYLPASESGWMHQTVKARFSTLRPPSTTSHSTYKHSTPLAHACSAFKTSRHPVHRI
jgi:hypothetical protein